MKTTIPRNIALYIALIAAALTVAVEMLFIHIHFESEIPVVIASSAVVMLGVYLLAYYILSDFIFRKINPIYKTIHNMKLSEKELRKTIKNPKLEEDLNMEVKNWATKKAQELDRLKEMERHRKEFLGNVSHELKTPIFNIQGYVLTLLEGGIDDPAINKLYLERAENSITRLINIVADLDTITRLDTAEMKIKFENFDIVQLTHEVFELQEMKTQKAGIRIMLKNKQESPIMVHADRKRIQEAMINLVLNSINYGCKNGTTTVDFIDMETKIMVEVADNGLGIPQGDLPRIFERFYRVEKSRSRHQGGTGLGLAIVKHVIEAHNETINVRSTEKKGTSFTFTLRKGR